MIFLYIFIPLIILGIPFLYSYKRLRPFYGVKALGIAFFYIVIFLIYLWNYITLLIIGGELILPISIILLRMFFVLPWVIVLLYISKIFCDIIERPASFNYFSIVRLGSHLRTNFMHVAFFYNLLFILFFAVLYLPRSLTVPYLEILVETIYILGFFLVFIGMFFLIGTYVSHLTQKQLIYLVSFLVSYFVLIGIISSIGIAGATLEGSIFIIIPLLTAIILYFKLTGGLEVSINRIHSRAVMLSMVIILAMLGQSFQPFELRGKADNAWNSGLEFTIDINATEFPIDLYNIRLVDRDLARDFAMSYRLPRIGNFQLRVGYEYENIGLIDGKPAWILPVYYSFSYTSEINYIVGYLYIHLDTPTFESMKFIEKKMTVAPGLYGSHDIDFFVKKVVPDGLIGEFYLIDPSPATSSPAWVVLIDRYSPWGIREPYKVLIIGSDGDYKLYDWYAANGIVPQLVSRYALESIIVNVGSTFRDNKKDYFAKGFIWIPASQDVQEVLEEEFYQTSHHFLLNHTFGRDFYLAVRTTGGEESVAVWILINSTLRLFDLRFYRGIGGVIRGVNTPSIALDAIEKLLSEKLSYAASVRYPKLYKVEVFGYTFLIWVALVAQKLPGADKPLGVAWVDASNPRILGLVQYVYGESHDIFMDRLFENIEASYKGWLGGNLTTLTTAYINGTVIRKDWALLQPDNEYAIIMSILNETGEMLTVVVLETKVATKQDFYNAVLAKEGDRVEINARWDIDLQAWVAYTVKLYPQTP